MMAPTAAMLMLNRQRNVPSSNTTSSPSVPSSSSSTSAALFHAMNRLFFSGTTSAFMQRSEELNKSNQSLAVFSSSASPDQ